MQKSKICRYCRQKYTPVRAIQPTCLSFECQLAHAQKIADRSKAKREKAQKAKERADFKRRKEESKTKGKVKREAQDAINKYRRLEELAKGERCISCGRSQEEVMASDGWKPGGAWDAGHFVSVGANESLRFEPKNIWLQCKSCNAGAGKYARKGATVAKSYEANLRAKEGDELVDWLKGPHEMKNYTIDDFRAIRDEYRRKVREINAD